MSKETLEEVGLGALLHDMGKMRTPVTILDKPGRPHGRRVRHPQETSGGRLPDAAQTGRLPRLALEIVQLHHERIGGEGYPIGLKGEEIPLHVRVVALAEVYDDITSDRVYHDGIPAANCLNMMFHWAPRDFGEDLMQEFIRCIGIYPIGSLVELNTGALGIVMSSNPDSRLKPVVMLVRDREGSALPAPPAAQPGGARPCGTAASPGGCSGWWTARITTSIRRASPRWKLGCELARHQLFLGNGLMLDTSEFEFSFVRASGPGGQNVNKVASCGGTALGHAQEHLPAVRACACVWRLWPVRASPTKACSSSRPNGIAPRSATGPMPWSGSSRWCEQALHPPKPRKKTRPTKASKRRRLDGKTPTGDKKRLRARDFD